jgi:hypothetical protein
VHNAFEPAIGERLLADSHAVFEAAGADRMAAAAIVGELIKDPTAPWAEFGGNAKPISPKRLAAMLKEFNIEPKKMRITGVAEPLRGYERADFADAWARYITVASPPCSVSRGFQSGTSGHVSDINYLGAKSSWSSRATENSPNSLKTNNSTDVPDRMAPETEQGGDRSCARCRGPYDGTQQLCAIDDEVVWLHPGCQAGYLEGPPW